MCLVSAVIRHSWCYVSPAPPMFWFWMNKVIDWRTPRLLAPSSPRKRERTADPKQDRKRRLFTQFIFLIFEKFFVSQFCSHGMDAASRFAALAHQGLPFYEFAGEFCKLAAATAWYDATLNKLFWLGPTTTVLWTSQTPPDWVAGKVFSGVWGVSGPEPEPARHRSQLPQARCRSRLPQACRCSRLFLTHRRSWPTQARHRPRLFLTGSEYGKPAGRGSPKPCARSSTAPSCAHSSTAPPRVCASRAPPRDRSPQ